MPRPGASGSEVYFGTTAPLAPHKGDFWFDGDNLQFRTDAGWLAVAVNATNFNTLSNNVSVLSQAVSVLSQAVSVISVANAAIVSAASSLSNAVSVLSQAVSVMSQAVSVLSNSVSVLSNAVSVISQQVSVLSQAHSALSQAHSALSVAHDTLSNVVSVISAGIGGVQLKVVTGAQIISGTTTTKISGLSVSCGAAAIYQVEGQLVFNMSVAQGININTSGTTSTLAVVGGRYATGVGVSTVSSDNVQQFPWITSVTPTTTSIFVSKLDAVLKTSAAFTIQMMAFVSAAGADMNIKAGSFIRAYKIG